MGKLLRPTCVNTNEYRPCNCPGSAAIGRWPKLGGRFRHLPEKGAPRLERCVIKQSNDGRRLANRRHAQLAATQQPLHNGRARVTRGALTAQQRPFRNPESRVRVTARRNKSRESCPVVWSGRRLCPGRDGDRRRRGLRRAWRRQFARSRTLRRNCDLFAFRVY